MSYLTGRTALVTGGDIGPVAVFLASDGSSPPT